MRTYGQYCPIARASELLAERWSIIVLRNIVILGCRTFNEIADGAPGLSRGLLSKRLRELEQAGVIEIRRKPDGRGCFYAPTEAGLELTQVMEALQSWGLEVGGSDARASTSRRRALDVGDLLSESSAVAAAPGPDPLRLSDPVGRWQSQLAAHRAGRRGDV
jgi:DNA-binding HxlR family transcriptional regulator